MPKNNEKEQVVPGGQGGIAKNIKELQDVVYASNYGLPREFIEKNERIVHNANKAVNDVLLGFGVNNLTSNINSLQELSSLVSQSIRFKKNKVSTTKEDMFNETDPKTGFKTITPLGNIDADEREIIDESAQLYQSFLNVTSEYRGVVKIIPEIDRAIKNIVRDILSVSELSGRILNEVYDDEDAVGGVTEDSKKATRVCNKLIQEEIIDKNKLETKLKRWVYESVVCGVKPVAFIPYDYIIRQLQHLNEGDDGVGLNVSKFNESVKSGEACCICSTESELKRFYEKSVESSFDDMMDVSAGESPEVKSDDYIDKILDDELCERYAAFCDSDTERVMESLPGAIDKAKDDDIRFYAVHGTHSAEANEQLELLEAMSKSYTTKKEEISKLSSDDKLKTARKGLKQLARFIDDHIDVVKTGASSAFIANKIMNQKDKYSKFYNLGENYLMAEGFKKKQKNSETDHTKSGSGTIEFDSESALGKDCLIVPYSPESVVPVNINGEYMGFYAMEYEHATGPQWKHRKRSGSFTDYVLQQGYGNDANFLGGNAPMVAYGGSDPLENNLYSPLALYNYSINQYMSGGGMDQQDQRFDIMKTVVLRVIAHRLRDPNLADNKVFKDAVMHMLRNDILVKRKVQFTFIPPEYMCYMTYQTDDDGIPKSILDGTLFFAYMYIASVVSSAMIKMLKSSDKEKYEVDVGLQKNAGYTIDELQRVLSTRTVYTSSMFSNLSSVLKNAGSYQRMIIPVFNDKKLYDVSQIEHVNDLNPDDDFTGKLLNSILSKIYVNAGMSSEMDSVDFAKQLSMRNLEYRNNIIEAQNNYEPFIQMQLRTLVNFSGLSCYNSKSENYQADKDKQENDTIAIDISRINPKLQIPTMLSMTNIVEMIDSAKNVANGIAEVMNLQDGSEVETARNTIFRKKIIQKYANIVEWDDVEAMLDEATREAPKVVNEHKKLAKIDEALQNPEDDGSGAGSNGGDMGGGF